MCTTPRASLVSGTLSTQKLTRDISDHMYRMGVMVFVARDPSLDTNKCIKMALVHDVAESIVGDITPHCGISKEEKHRMETEAMHKITDMLGEEHSEAGETVFWSA